MAYIVSNVRDHQNHQALESPSKCFIQCLTKCATLEGTELQSHAACSEPPGDSMTEVFIANGRSPWMSHGGDFFLFHSSKLLAFAAVCSWGTFLACLQVLKPNNLALLNQMLQGLGIFVKRCVIFSTNNCLKIRLEFQTLQDSGLLSKLSLLHSFTL